jgi:hypothetical protein
MDALTFRTPHFVRFLGGLMIGVALWVMVFAASAAGQFAA